LKTASAGELGAAPALFKRAHENFYHSLDHAASKLFSIGFTATLACQERKALAEF
jgi:hypothetical protein